MIRGRARNNLRIARRSGDGSRCKTTTVVLSKGCLKIHTRIAGIGACSTTPYFCCAKVKKLFRSSSKYVSSTDLC